MKNIQLIITPFFFIAINLTIYAQDSLRSKLTKTENIRWHLFNNEIDVEVGNLFLTQNGVTLLYKRRYEHGQFVRVKQTRALRYLMSLQLNMSGKAFKQDKIEINGNSYYLTGYHQKGISAMLGMGYEMQENMGRFQLYYGADLMASYQFGNQNNHGNSYLIYSFYPNTGSSFSNYIPINISDEISSKSYNADLAIFAGIRFFLHPRLSLSLESNIGLGFSRIIVKSINGIDNFLHQSNEFRLGTNSVRFFTLNYHF